MSKTLTSTEAGKFIDGIVDVLEKPQASEVLGEWNDILAGDLAEGFLNSQSPTGDAWAPLKNPRPPGHNQGARPLIDTGTLMQSVVSDGQGHIEIVTEDSTIFGTDIEYAAVQNFGTKKQPGVPARPFMGVPHTTLTVAAEMLGNHVISVIASK